MYRSISLAFAKINVFIFNAELSNIAAVVCKRLDVYIFNSYFDNCEKWAQCDDRRRNTENTVKKMETGNSPGQF